VVATHYALTVGLAFNTGLAVAGILIGAVLLYRLRQAVARGEVLARVIGRLVIQETGKIRRIHDR